CPRAGGRLPTPLPAPPPPRPPRRRRPHGPRRPAAVPRGVQSVLPHTARLLLLPVAGEEGPGAVPTRSLRTPALPLPWGENPAHSCALQQLQLPGH
ncbi:hypothetical protein Q9966_008036, partial [Columba livia]